MLLFSWESFP